MYDKYTQILTNTYKFTNCGETESEMVRYRNNMSLALASLILATSLIAIPQSTKPAMASVLVGPIENPSNGHLYYAISRNTWTGAEAEAQSLGGHLVTINDEAENKWVWETFVPRVGGPLWIGLNDADQEGTFVWSSGEPATYFNWWCRSQTDCEPNNISGAEDYAEMNNYVWNDNTNERPFVGIVEVKEDQQSDTEPPIISSLTAVDGNNQELSDGDGDVTTLSTSIKFTFEATDNEDAPEDLTFECRLDSADEQDFAVCTSPKEYTDLEFGEHTFEVRATDSSDNTGPTAAFIWTILTSEQATQNVIDYIKGLNLDRGTQNPLIMPLEAVKRNIANGNTADACATLSDFLTKVNDFEGNGKLTSNQADEIRGQAGDIQKALGC